MSDVQQKRLSESQSHFFVPIPKLQLKYRKHFRTTAVIFAVRYPTQQNAASQILSPAGVRRPTPFSCRQSSTNRKNHCTAERILERHIEKTHAFENDVFAAEQFLPWFWTRHFWADGQEHARRVGERIHFGQNFGLRSVLRKA